MYRYQVPGTYVCVVMGACFYPAPKGYIGQSRLEEIGPSNGLHGHVERIAWTILSYALEPLSIF